MSGGVIVVGAGLGGLAAAIRLRLQGRAVRVLERMDRVGGRCNRFEAEGFRFDTGPSLLMMLDPLRALFAEAGRRLEDELELVRLETHSVMRFPDGSELTLSSDRARLTREFERFAPGAGDRLARWLEATAPLFRVGMADFIEAPNVRLGGLLNPRKAVHFMHGRVLGRLERHLRRHLGDPRLAQALAYPALYLGLNPCDAPAIYALLAYGELTGGLYFPRGGMYAVPEALARLARALGVEVLTGCEVTDVATEGGLARAVRLSDGASLEADQIVINADVPEAYARLLKRPMPQGRRLVYGCSAYLLYLGVRGRYPQLPHHLVVMPKDLPGSMAALFERQRIPEDPLFYVAAPTRTDPSLAPPDHESLFVLVPVPHADAGIDWTTAGPLLGERMLARLEREGLVDLRERLVVQRQVTPEAMRHDWRLGAGAAFGLSHALSQMGFLRPRNRDGRLRNVYFVGASTRPGGGIPLVLTSGRLVAERIAREWPPC